MPHDHHDIILRADHDFHGKFPPTPVGAALRLIPSVVRGSIRMRFQGRSSARGTAPRWLDRSSDIRLISVTGRRDETVLRFAAPRLGEAAAELFEQEELWPSRPIESDTGFDLLGDIVQEIRRGRRDSNRFDQRLLHDVASFRNALNGTFQELVIVSDRYVEEKPAVITKNIIEKAQDFYDQTPAPQPARIVGTLDMIRASTKAFALQLPNGEDVRAVLTAKASIDDLTALFRQDVLVVGMAVFRPSGHLLRIDATEVRLATTHDSFFAKLPEPRVKRLTKTLLHRLGKENGGIGRTFGKWPGNETDEEIESVLRELS